MKKKSITRNYIYNLTYQILILITPLITTPYLSRILGPTGIGNFSYACSIVTYFVLLGSLGSSLYGQREIAYYQDNPLERTRIFKEIIVMRGFTVLISFVIYCFFFISQQKSIIYLILGVEIISAALDISWFFQGMEEFKKIIMRNIIIKIVSILLIFLLVKEPSDLPIYAICYTAPILIGNLSLWIIIPQFLLRNSKVNINIYRHFRPMFVLFIPQLAIEIYTVLDKTMLGMLSMDIAEVGYYEQSQKIIKIVLRIITAMGIVMLPKNAQAFSKAQFNEIKENIRKTFQFVFFLGFPMVCGLIGISATFVPWFFGDGYEKVTVLLVSMSPLILIIGLSNVLGVQYLLPTQKQKMYTISVVLGAILNFTLNLLLIPKYSCYGSAVATILAEIGVLLCQIKMTSNHLPIGSYLKNILQYFMISSIMGGVIYLLGVYSPPTIFTTAFQIMIGIAIYILGLIIVKNSILIEGLSNLKKKIIRGEN